jgi:hypothetical protein
MNIRPNFLCLVSSRLEGAVQGVEAARQIDAAAKTVANQILTEQFDTVMPLLKELYRRLRPHADWAEIESDFGGKVRGSLNFTVGDGHNPLWRLRLISTRMPCGASANLCGVCLRR